MHVAAIRGQGEAVKVLCVMGARAGEKRADGRTAAQVAKVNEIKWYLEGREKTDTNGLVARTDSKKSRKSAAMRSK